jgi:hypothetical protein
MIPEGKGPSSDHEAADRYRLQCELATYYIRARYIDPGREEMVHVLESEIGAICKVRIFSQEGEEFNVNTSTHRLTRLTSLQRTVARQKIASSNIRGDK